MNGGGEKFGLVGLTDPVYARFSNLGHNIIFLDPIPVVQDEVNKLTASGVNKIILLSHSGYDFDKAVAANTTGIDVIVGGHSNTFLSNTSKSAEGPYPVMVGITAIVQAYAYGKILGELNVTFDEDGNIYKVTGEPLILDSSVIEDTITKAQIFKAAKPLLKIKNTIIKNLSVQELLILVIKKLLRPIKLNFYKIYNWIN